MARKGLLTLTLIGLLAAGYGISKSNSVLNIPLFDLADRFLESETARQVKYHAPEASELVDRRVLPWITPKYNLYIRPYEMGFAIEYIDEALEKFSRVDLTEFDTNTYPDAWGYNSMNERVEGTLMDVRAKLVEKEKEGRTIPSSEFISEKLLLELLVWDVEDIQERADDAVLTAWNKSLDYMQYMGRGLLSGSITVALIALLGAFYAMSAKDPEDYFAIAESLNH